MCGQKYTGFFLSTKQELKMCSCDQKIWINWQISCILSTQKSNERGLCFLYNAN
jgi:hypothetical protein